MIYPCIVHGGVSTEKKSIIGGIIFLLLIAGFSGCVGPQVSEHFDESYLVNEHTILKVININGQVEITGWDSRNVTVNAVKHSSFGQEELDKIEIDVTTLGNYLTIETKYTGSSILQGSVDYDIKVPRNLSIESVTTSNGAILITNSKGDVTIQSSNGAILVDNVNGYVTAQTSNARIEVRNTIGIGDIHTSNGALTIEVADIRDNVSIDTSNAAINVYLNSSLNATIEMMTSNNRITIEGISVNVTLSEDTHVLGTLGSNGKRIDIHTSNAKIQLFALES